MLKDRKSALFTNNFETLALMIGRKDRWLINSYVWLANQTSLDVT